MITEVRVHRYSANKKKTEIDHRHDNHSVITSNLWHFISYRVTFDAIHVFPILFFWHPFRNRMSLSANSDGVYIIILSVKRGHFFSKLSIKPKSKRVQQWSLFKIQTKAE